MAIGNVGIAARTAKVASANQFKSFVGRYFYFVMSFVMAAVIIAGFSRTINANLLHANPPRPALLWAHGAAFSAWLIFFITQSGLVRIRKVSVHRLIGWFGAALAATMVVLGFAVSIVMTRFDTLVLNQKDADAFISIPFLDMIVFGSLVGLAIYFRKRPGYHRPLLFIASCHLMDAGIGRFDFWFNHNLFYPFLDFLIVLGMLRDWYVDGRISKVYLYVLPPLVLMQTFAIYAWRTNPSWYQTITHAIIW